MTSRCPRCHYLTLEYNKVNQSGKTWIITKCLREVCGYKEEKEIKEKNDDMAK